MAGMELLTRQWCLDHMADWLLSTGPAGFVVEVGVYQGGSLAYLASRLPGRRLYGYDTFTGLVGCGAEDGHRDGDFACTEAVARKHLERYGNVALIVGQYPESDLDPPSPVALAHVDVDLYRPTLAALGHLWPLLAPGGRVYAGDAYWPSCPGATKALDEFCRGAGVRPEKAWSPRRPVLDWFEPEPCPPLAYVEKPCD